jgi:hypothetical protein
MVIHDYLQSRERRARLTTLRPRAVEQTVPRLRILDVKRWRAMAGTVLARWAAYGTRLRCGAQDREPKSCLDVRVRAADVSCPPALSHEAEQPGEEVVAEGV